LEASLAREKASLRSQSGTGGSRAPAFGSLASLGISAAAILVGLAVWELVWREHWVASYSLPGPRDVAREWWLLSQHGILWHHTYATVREAALGFLAAFVVAIVVGYPLAKSHVLASVLSPYVAATQAMPIIALAPVLIVWFGLGLASKTLICAIIVFFPMLVTVAVGIRNVDRTLVEAAATEGAGRWRTFRYVEFPLALRTILAGVRMGLTLAMTGAIVAEFVAASSGLGYAMEYARSLYNAPMLFAYSLTMVGLAVAAYIFVGLLEHVLIDWD
jgi:NitT/TauT family transport system permease protein